MSLLRRPLRRSLLTLALSVSLGSAGCGDEAATGSDGAGSTLDVADIGGDGTIGTDTAAFDTTADGSGTPDAAAPDVASPDAAPDDATLDTALGDADAGEPTDTAGPEDADATSPDADATSSDATPDADATSPDADAPDADATSPDAGDASTPIEDGPAWFLGGDCDPLVPTYCAYPFPSDVWTVQDPSTPTGRRIKIGPTTASLAGGTMVPDTSYFDWSDGFSAGATLLAHLPGATITGLVDPSHLEDSLADTSATVIIDAETGERVLHFAELDSWPAGDERTFMLRPMERLADSTRYIVAIRNVKDAEGTPLEPSPAFAALRDGTVTDPVLARRVDWYEDIFGRLESAGVERGDLQLAWDFTTASRENNTHGMLVMRDESLAAMGPEGAPYFIDKVEVDPTPELARIIEGRITVPLYLDDPGPGGISLLDEDGVPIQNGTAEYPFLLMIPKSAEQEPATLLQYGHGLFGSRESMLSGDYQKLANQFNFVMFATDLYGMSNKDIPVIASAIVTGNLTDFRSVPDRGRQAFLTMMVLARTMTGALVADPQVQVSELAPWSIDDVYYLGGSQGGIYGASYMALTPDIERGVLAVPGQPYALMLPRSVHFDQFWGLMKGLFDPLDVPFVLGAAQMLWDRCEPNGYSYAISKDLLPNTPPHDVLVIEAIGDHQVPNLSTDVMVRAIGAAHLVPNNGALFGVPTVGAPAEGSVFVDVSYGLPPVPLENQPMRDGSDPHGKVVDNAAIIQMVDFFLRAAVVPATCEGPCDPE